MALHPFLITEYLKEMAAILTKLDQGYEMYAKRLSRLCADLSEREWSIRDIADAKARLRERNSEYADALDRGDWGVFVEKYPALFEVETPAEMRGAAERILCRNSHRRRREDRYNVFDEDGKQGGYWKKDPLREGHPPSREAEIMKKDTTPPSFNLKHMGVVWQHETRPQNFSWRFFGVGPER